MKIIIFPNSIVIPFQTDISKPHKLFPNYKHWGSRISMLAPLKEAIQPFISTGKTFPCIMIA